MGQFYIVTSAYNPNTAPTNRLLSFLQGFSELEVDVELVYFIANSTKSKRERNTTC